MSGDDTAARPLVAVLLGTDHHRFDRLLGWIAELAEQSDLRWFVQHGHTPLTDSLEGRPMVPARTLGRLLDEASVVVTHGGPGLIMDARSAGHLPVVVPRDPAFGEHVDDHQLAFTRRLESSGGIRTVNSAVELEQAVREEIQARSIRGAEVEAALAVDAQSRRAAERFGQLVDALHSHGSAAARQEPAVSALPSEAAATLASATVSAAASAGVVVPAARGSRTTVAGSSPSRPDSPAHRAAGPGGRRAARRGTGSSTPGSRSSLLRGGTSTQRSARLWDAVAGARPVTMLTAELSAASLVIAALGADFALLALWALTMTIVHGNGAKHAEREPVRHSAQLGAVALGLSAALAFFGGLSLEPQPTMVAVTAMAAATAVVHALRGTARRRTGTEAPRVVLVGPSTQMPALLADIARPGGTRLDVVGACLTDVDRVPAELCLVLPPNVPVTTGEPSILPVVRVMKADAVMTLPWAGLDPAQLRRLEWELGHQGAELWLAPGLVDTDPARTELLPAGAARILRVRPSSMHGSRRILKSAGERTVAAVGLLVILPVLLALMALVRAEDGGSALFRQRRVGKDGREFTLYKLRTMVPDAEARLDALVLANEADGILFKLRQDPRVTRIGRLLRRFSLDELPQLWNVVRGEMSLIGPRPSLPREVADYAPDTHRRLAVKPGLTGLWQVSGRSDLSWEESERLDLKYVDNWSLRLDLSILLRTCRAVLSRQGAY